MSKLSPFLAGSSKIYYIVNSRDGSGLGGARKAAATTMIDWITILIEAVGVAILLMWIVIPIREFRDILRVLKRKRRRESSGEDGPSA
jgi:hypothetical protein